MKTYDIFNRVSKSFPGGLMTCGMFLVAVVNTFFPEIFQVGYATTGLFTSVGNMTMIGMVIFISGTQLKAKEFGISIMRGGCFLVLRFVTGIAASVILHNLFGRDGFLGIPTIALVIVLSSLNPGIYMASMNSYGNAVDKAAFGVFSLWSNPAIPLIILNLSFGGKFDWNVVIAAFIPFFLGFVLANLDPAFAKFFGPAAPVVLFFLGMSFGTSMNLVTIVKSGPSAVALVVIYTIISVTLSVLVDKIVLRGRGYVGAGSCCIGKSFIGSAAVIGAALPEYAPYIGTVAAQIAFASIITSFSAPYITGLFAKKYGCPVFDAQKAASSEN